MDRMIETIYFASVAFFGAVIAGAHHIFNHLYAKPAPAKPQFISICATRSDFTDYNYPEDVQTIYIEYISHIQFNTLHLPPHITTVHKLILPNNTCSLNLGYNDLEDIDDIILPPKLSTLHRLTMCCYQNPWRN